MPSLAIDQWIVLGLLILFMLWVFSRMLRAARKPPIPRSMKRKARSHWGVAVGPFFFWF
ncbi:MAG: hypothetical protein JO352_27340 [Chloroflexi bacterium]|nr:hypothetical protein [Chloroflexota bacterium]MBV9602090.1 hypothetical protein [Chloroflexota bacterium]